MHMEQNSVLISNFAAMLENRSIYMDQAARLKMKLKRIWTKFVQPEVSDQPVKRV